MKAQGRVQLSQRRLRLKRGLWIPDKSSGSARPAPPLYAARVAAPPRRALHVRWCALPRGLRHGLSSTSAGPLPLSHALAGLRKSSPGSASGLRARGPCASPLLQQPQGASGTQFRLSSDPLQGPHHPRFPTPLPHRRTHTRTRFLWNALSSENNNIGRMTAGVCRVQAPCPGPCAPSDQLEAEAGPAPGIPRAAVSRRWARHALLPPEGSQPRRPGRDRIGSRAESAKPEFPDPAPTAG